MEVRNCTTCGRMFNSVMEIKRCNACRQADDVHFKMIKEYLYDAPGASIEEVSENLDISRTTILNFLREGRLETIGANMVIQCEHCGKLINSGKYCDSCQRDIALDMKSAAKTMSRNQGRKDKGSGMHVKHKKK